MTRNFQAAYMHALLRFCLLYSLFYLTGWIQRFFLGLVRYMNKKIIANLGIWFNWKHSEINTLDKYLSIKDLEGFKTVFDISQSVLKKTVNPLLLALEITYIVLRNLQWDFKRGKWMNFERVKDKHWFWTIYLDISWL